MSEHECSTGETEKECCKAAVARYKIAAEKKEAERQKTKELRGLKYDFWMFLVIGALGPISFFFGTASSGWSNLTVLAWILVWSIRKDTKKLKAELATVPTPKES